MGLVFSDTSDSGGATDKIIRSTRRKGIPAPSNDWGRVGPTIDGPDLPANMVARSGRSIILRNLRRHSGSDGYKWKGPTNGARTSPLTKPLPLGFTPPPPNFSLPSLSFSLYFSLWAFWGKGEPAIADEDRGGDVDGLSRRISGGGASVAVFSFSSKIGFRADKFSLFFTSLSPDKILQGFKNIAFVPESFWGVEIDYKGGFVALLGKGEVFF